MITVVIITHNEERNIGRCLEAASHVADEIVVVDSFSQDKTQDICVSFGVKFLSRQWEGYSKSKNYGNAQASHNYILSLDADEVLSEELIKSINEIKNKPVGAYKFNRLTNYAGKWVRHCGWYPDAKIRLFPKDKTRWEGDFVHEVLMIDDDVPVYHLKGDLLHYSYKSKADHLLRIEKYSELHAQKMFSEGKKSGFLRKIFSPFTKFVRDYVFQLGFLDGKTGFAICRLSAKAVYLKYVKLEQLIRNQ